MLRITPTQRHYRSVVEVTARPALDLRDRRPLLELTRDLSERLPAGERVVLSGQSHRAR
jgi:hypothetical protein